MKLVGNTMNETKTSPFGNVPTVFTHESIYTVNREIVNRFFIATFAAPSALMNIVLPVIAHDKEGMDWIEYYGNIRPLGPHSHQAPSETFYNRSKKVKFDMQWYGLSFSLDSSLATTPAWDYMASQNMSLLRADVNLTILTEMMSKFMKIPDIYALEKQRLMVKNYKRVVEETAEKSVLDLREMLPGFLDSQGPSPLS